MVVVSVRPPQVELEWGGALTGHHGIRYCRVPGGVSATVDDFAFFLASGQTGYFYTPN